jgi:ribosome modulation factor
MSSKFLINYNDKTVWREHGYNDAYHGRKKQEEFPSADARSGYFEGWRLGTRAREADAA